MQTALPVTAFSLCNALGTTTAEVLANLRAGSSGLRPANLDLPFETWCGAVRDVLEPVPARLLAYDTRQVRLGLRVLEELRPQIERAARRWGKDRVALVLGTSTGGIEETERAYNGWRRTGSVPKGFDWDRKHSMSALLEVFRSETGLRGPGYVVSTACSSSGKVFASARRLIAAGLCDAVLAGGVDTLCQTTLRGFSSLGVLDAKPCRPFSSERRGISIGEGAALALLEREGSAAVALLGCGETSDAHHMTAPAPDGSGALAAMAQSLTSAGLTPAQVDYVNAHGTGTVLNDAAEAKAIRALLGETVPVSSTKGYTGHMLGAAGATEALFSVAAIAQGFIPASIGAGPLDPELRIRVACERLEVSCRVVVSNSLAFGGSNVSLVFGAMS
jgi:3-oxoacyl-[acyl-carrier-protein] synthase-1